MQISNSNISSLLMNMQHMQIQEAVKQVEVSVAAQVGLEANNIDLIAPEVSEAISEMVESIAYTAEGSVVDSVGSSVSILA